MLVKMIFNFNLYSLWYVIWKNPKNYLIDFYLFKTCFWIRPRIFFQITAAAIFHSTFLLDLFYLYFSKFFFFLWAWVKNKTIKLSRIIAHVSNLMYCSKTSSSHSFKNNLKQQYLQKKKWFNRILTSSTI